MRFAARAMSELLYAVKAAFGRGQLRAARFARRARWPGLTDLRAR